MKSKHKYYNPNPLKKETGDCVVRALVKATGKSWDEVYKELCEIGFELKVMPNSDEAWKEFLLRNSFEYCKIQVKKGSKRPTVESFAKEHKKGIYVLRVANHLVTVHDGYYYDIWDSGKKSLYGFYKKVIDTEV